MSGLNPSRRALQPGERIGSYLLVRQLGSGGMAEVWLAQRADGTFKREVALKVPLSGLHENLAKRFGREREILAALEHPNIARMYDAGISSEGLPYLVMEYVRGEPLIAWCDAHRLPVCERLKLFMQVLEAVQYAHSHQVIHRDIKPGNVLVTDAGQARLLDFGVAKLLTQDDEQTELTRWYGRALTPEYASPELVRGGAIDAASDVYSLGIVMYELLCGCRPYQVKTGTPMRLVERLIASTPVERPSTRVGPEAGNARGTTRAALVQGLRGDLDAIVLKALARSARGRYRSAAEMADEVRCYLTGEPAQAGSGRFFHRLTTSLLRRRARPTFATSPRPGCARTGAVGPKRSTFAPFAAFRARHGSLPRPSIAVLPFVDIGGQKDQECFCDGLADELIAHLTCFPRLRVIARTSSFYFKGKQATIAQIAETLGVTYVLEGSVRKSGNMLRINARLIDADGSHLWSRTYDRKCIDVFELQDEISRNVVQELAIAFLSIEPTGPSGPARASPAVRDAPTLTTELISSDPDLRLNAPR
jgi:eukaryotic-like serine/threonine-protein kinase